MVTVRVCDGNCGHLDPPITCRAPINADVAHPRVYSDRHIRLDVPNQRRSRLRHAPAPDPEPRGIDRIRLGQTSTATAPASTARGGCRSIPPDAPTPSTTNSCSPSSITQNRPQSFPQTIRPLTLEGQPLARGLRLLEGPPTGPTLARVLVFGDGHRHPPPPERPASSGAAPRSQPRSATTAYTDAPPPNEA